MGKHTCIHAEKRDLLQELDTTAACTTCASSLGCPTQVKLADRSLFSAVTYHQKTSSRQSVNALFALA